VRLRAGGSPAEGKFLLDNEVGALSLRLKTVLGGSKKTARIFKITCFSRPKWGRTKRQREVG